MTPGTLDRFLMATVEVRRWRMNMWTEHVRLDMTTDQQPSLAC